MYWSKAGNILSKTNPQAEVLGIGIGCQAYLKLSKYCLLIGKHLGFSFQCQELANPKLVVCAGPS